MLTWELVHIPPIAPFMKEFQEHPHAKSWMRLISQFMQHSQTQQTLCTLCDNRIGWGGNFDFDALILYPSMPTDKNCVVMGVCTACLKAYDDVDERCVEKLRKGIVGFSDLKILSGISLFSSKRN